MKIGYARVSTQDQNLHLQTDALKAAGCEKIFFEKIGATKERPEFEKMKAALRSGDTIVVWKLDRLGRTMKQLVNLVTEWEKEKIDFVSLQDAIDTKTAMGRFFFNISAALTALERELTVERTHAGLAAARARGRNGGRPKGLTKESMAKAQTAAMLYREKKLIPDICKILNTSAATVYRWLEAVGQPRTL